MPFCGIVLLLNEGVVSKKAIWGTRQLNSALVPKYRTKIAKLQCKSLPALYYVDLFSYKVYREMPIQSYVTDNELEAVLNVIDMDSEKGKRDKAIILLAASTGMRACDIIRMQLTDIDWRRGEIRIVQHMYGMRRLNSP